MTIIVTGKIERQGFGSGTWALVTPEGKTYELKDPPPQLCRAVTAAKVVGVIRDDVMTLAMIGPVLEVQTFEVLME
jgi:hypothetical protein